MHALTGFRGGGIVALMSGERVTKDAKVFFGVPRLGYGHLDVIPVDSTLVIHIIDPVTEGKAIVDEVTMGPMIWAVLGGIDPRIDVLPLWRELNCIAGHESEEHVLESLRERRVVRPFGARSGVSRRRGNGRVRLGGVRWELVRVGRRVGRRMGGFVGRPQRLAAGTDRLIDGHPLGGGCRRSLASLGLPFKEWWERGVLDLILDHPSSIIKMCKGGKLTKHQ